MFDRSTQRAKQTMNLARQEAQRLNHEYLSTEHILLGLTRVDGGVALTVLRSLGIDPVAIRTEVEKIVKSGPSMATMGQLPFTPRAKKVLELSMEEAGRHGHNYFGTEHLLLGLVREEHGIAAQVLRKLGAQVETVRAKVVESLQSGAQDDAEKGTGSFSGVSPDVSALLTCVGVLRGHREYELADAVERVAQSIVRKP